MKTQSALVLTTAAAALLLSGCATTLPKPLHSTTDFRPETMDMVYLLPVIDSRPSKELLLDAILLQERVLNVLKGKRYQASSLTDTSLVAGISHDDLKQPSPDWIKRTGPSSARWLMLLEVVDLSRTLTFGSTGSAEVKLFIFDKQTGTTVWTDKALSRVGQGGLAGMAMVSLMDKEALKAAVGQVLYKIPKKR